MIASESVLFPDPFGPMIAWTDPLSTVRSMPLRICFPSTLTCRSRISRLDNGPLPGGGLRELGEGHAVERLRDRRLELEPDRARAAVGLAHAIQDRVPLGGTDLRLYRSLERANDVARGDRLRLAREYVAPSRAALPVHQTRPAERSHQLLEIGLRQVFALRDSVQRDRSLPPVPREVDHEPHPVLATRGDVESGRLKGISDHF